jgi:hypothetical protein
MTPSADLVGLADRLARAWNLPLWQLKMEVNAVSNELRALAGAEVGGDYVLPCDVKVWPATVITKGCKLSTLIKCIQLRDGPDPFPNADYEKLGELFRERLIPETPPPGSGRG